MPPLRRDDSRVAYDHFAKDEEERLGRLGLPIPNDVLQWSDHLQGTYNESTRANYLKIAQRELESKEAATGAKVLEKQMDKEIRDFDARYAMVDKANKLANSLASVRKYSWQDTVVPVRSVTMDVHGWILTCTDPDSPPSCCRSYSQYFSGARHE
jgi:hypothetical protein